MKILLKLFVVVILSSFLLSLFIAQQFYARIIAESMFTYSNESLFFVETVLARDIQNDIEFNYKNTYAVNYYKKQEYKSIPFELVTDTDPDFLQGKKYIMPGKEGQQIISEKWVSFSSGIEDPQQKLITKGITEELQSEPATEVSGARLVDEVMSDVSRLEIDTYIYDEEIAAEKQEITIFQDEVLIFEESIKGVFVGTQKIMFQPCNYYIHAPIVYNPTNKIYYVDAELVARFACIEDIIYEEPIELLVCTDCTFARVDKTHRLPSTYIPNIIELAGLGFEGSIYESAFDDLSELLQAGEEAGFKINITSAYRSYAEQEEVFYFWVDREINLAGKSEQDAINSANNYSAIPGFSEHQLGTTVDLNSQECESFDGYCPFNEALWSWIEANAVNYGFIMSYPKGKEARTGYIFEPWHYRWVGKEYALSFSSQTELTLNEWLEFQTFN